MKKSAEEEREAELDDTKIQKRYEENILQSTLTRIMKSRIGQRTTHVWLINEVARQIELFRAHSKQIKENIEKLIAKILWKEMKMIELAMNILLKGLFN